MAPALIVVEDVDRDRDLVKRARSFALGEESDLIVLSLVTPDEYENATETLNTIGEVENKTYGETEVLDSLSESVNEMVSSVLREAVEYEVRTRVIKSDKQADTILKEANRTDCDHVFLKGRQRSPTGKAVFGDRTQQIILNFDGFATVTME